MLALTAAAMKNYLPNPMRATLASVRSASCRCRLIHKHQNFIHAAAKRFVMAVIMPMT